jgi:hypothetical protein
MHWTPFPGMAIPPHSKITADYKKSGIFLRRQLFSSQKGQSLIEPNWLGRHHAK